MNKFEEKKNYFKIKLNLRLFVSTIQSGTMSATPANITDSVDEAVHTCNVQTNEFRVELLYNGMSAICLSRTVDPIPYVMVKCLINDGEFNSDIFCTILLSRHAAPST